MYSETSVMRTPLEPLLAVMYSETSIMRTPFGPLLTVLFVEESLFQRFYTCMYTCECKGCQMGQSSGVLLKGGGCI